MTSFRAAGLGVVALTIAISGPPLAAQALGTFRWQLQPFCNIVTVNVTQQGEVYTLDGYDNQCGSTQRAPLVGLATPNPDGTIGLGLHVVTVPGGRGLQIDARISLATLNGPWSDSSGNVGTFVYGADSGGPPRPAPTIPGSSIAAGSITTTQLAAGAVTAAQLAPGVIGAVAQTRVTGVCAYGQSLRGINPDGTVVCTDAHSTADDPANDVGLYSSMAIDSSGRPVISHYDQTAQRIRVTRCGNPACSAGNVSTTVDNLANVTVGTSIGIGTDGRPVISHYNDGLGNLRFTRCGNAACTAGNVSTNLDLFGLMSSLAIGADGFPVISTWNGTDGALRVTHCGNAACSAGNTSVNADDPANTVGVWSSLAIAPDSRPVISHIDDTADAVRVTKCSNAACTGPNISTTVDNAVLVFSRTSIAIGSDGLPIIAYQDSSAGALRVTHCGNAACTAGNVSTTVDNPTNIVGVQPSVAIGSDGLAVISHRDNTAGALRVTNCLNVACTLGISVTVDDPANSVGQWSAIKFGADGLPVISHYDATAGLLRVAKCGTRTCL